MRPAKIHFKICLNLHRKKKEIGCERQKINPKKYQTVAVKELKTKNAKSDELILFCG